MVLNLRFMTLILVENLVIVGDLNKLESITAKKMPNLNLLDKLVMDPFANEIIVPMKAIIISRLYPFLGPLKQI
jgi:hypothetical protein